MSMSETALAFVTARGIDPELAVKLGLESYQNAGGEWLKFPYFVGAEVVNHKHRRLDQKQFHQDKDATKCFFNFNVIADVTLEAEPLIITEGEFDAMVAIQCGYVRTVSVPDGAPAAAIGEEESRKYEYLTHARAALRDCREVILAVDSDGPGQNLLNDLAVRIGKAKCKWVRYPKGCKDFNDTLLRYGERGVHETIRRAEWMRVDGVYHMSELPPYPARARFSTQMPGMDPHYNVRMGDFAVITGRPGDGKSTYVTDMLCRMVSEFDWTVAIASFEQHPQADHRRALREWFLRSPVENGIGQMLVTDAQLAAADAWIDEHFLFVVPSDDDLASLEWTLDKCAAAVIRYGARVVVIDPWNELDHDRPRDMSLTEYTGKAIKEFKRLARNLDVHVLVVAHPTKLDGKDKPGLYSISDSAHWANKSDVGIILWKPDKEGDRVEVKIGKSRYHDQIGRPGTVWMAFNDKTRRFHSSTPPPEEAGATRAPSR